MENLFTSKVPTADIFPYAMDKDGKRTMGNVTKLLNMETMNRPRLKNLSHGESHKVLEIEGNHGMFMPPHHSTGEAVIVIKKGSVLIKMPDTEHKLEVGNILIIPAKKEHTLTALKEFKALVIMALDSEIYFI